MRGIIGIELGQFRDVVDHFVVAVDKALDGIRDFARVGGDRNAGVAHASQVQGQARHQSGERIGGADGLEPAGAVGIAPKDNRGIFAIHTR